MSEMRFLVAHAVGKTGAVAAVYITDEGLANAAKKSFLADES